MTTALQVGVARDWKALFKNAGALRTDELVSGDKYALVLGPVTIGASSSGGTARDRVVVPKTSHLVAVHAQGKPVGTTQVDVYEEDGSPATILSAPIDLNQPSSNGGEPISVDGVGVVADATHSAGTVLSLQGVTGSGESIVDAQVELIFTVD